ncbi:MAG TPA: 23S rRNA (guanosine(2251)-2'-O)-methyltransferase RlmB [Acidothermaceae bacterium]
MAGGKRGGQGGRGAKPGSHRKGASVGSGGQKRKGLEGRGPTPPASERKGHAAARQARRADAAAAPVGRTGRPAASGRPSATGAGRPAAGRSAGGRSSSATRTVAGGRPTTTRRPTRTTRPDPNAPEVVAGRNPVVEALRASIPATALYVATGIELDERVREAIKLANDLRIPLLDAERMELDRYAQGAVHQGLVLQVPPFDYLHPDELLDRAFSSGVPLLVALDGVTDPRNLGAVVRSVGAFGGHGVLVPERRSAGMTAGAWKASAGAAARVPVARATNLTRALTAYAERGLLVVGLAGRGSLDLMDLEAATEPLVLVVGSEGKGLSRLVQERCDIVVRIPIASATESLNASVAAGVALYEVARRRGNR